MRRLGGLRHRSEADARITRLMLTMIMHVWQCQDPPAAWSLSNGRNHGCIVHTARFAICVWVCVCVAALTFGVFSMSVSTARWAITSVLPRLCLRVGSFCHPLRMPGASVEQGIFLNRVAVRRLASFFDDPTQLKA